ncbi:MAG: hypothetical protein ACI9U2_000523 [Bradymonadia bacterium]|jgi:hypothetical protein
MTLIERLDDLRARGASAYDEPGLRFVEALLERAATLDGGVAERLQARASARLSAFRTSMQAAQVESAAAVSTLTAADADANGALAAAHAQGDYKRVVREARGALRRVHATDPHARLARLSAQAEAQGLTVRDAPDDAARAADHIAHALFRQAADQVRGTLTVARAVDRLPAETGPYNPDALTARALAAMEALAPGWMRARLAALEDLAVLTTLRRK